MADSSSSSGNVKKKEPKNWDKIVQDFEEEEKKVSGESSVDELFRQIYSQGDENVRKAMNKSFVESCGTVLSTNWKDVKEKEIDVKPPDGVEHKKY
ncbi:Glucose-insensitive transcription protein 7 [Halotydeus destructor]|nr:Glucose-insensitive transcription protein 7 [Halotydeus destructor]